MCHKNWWFSSAVTVNVKTHIAFFFLEGEVGWVDPPPAPLQHVWDAAAVGGAHPLGGPKQWALRAGRRARRRTRAGTRAPWEEGRRGEGGEECGPAGGGGKDKKTKIPIQGGALEHDVLLPHAPWIDADNKDASLFSAEQFYKLSSLSP